MRNLKSIYLVAILAITISNNAFGNGQEQYENVPIDCYHTSTDGRANGTIIGSTAGIGIGGGLCAAGVALSGLTFGITAVIGCSAGALIGAGTGAYIGAEIGNSYDYECPKPK